METKEIYVGTRKNRNEVGEIIGRGVYSLNENLSKNLRGSVLKHGIKKTEQRKRLEFINITQDELNKFDKEIIPLVVIDGEKLTKSIDEVNSRFPRRMDYEIGLKYKEELELSMESSVTIIGKDTNFRKKPNVLNTKNPYKVGDWIVPEKYHNSRYRGYSKQVRIWKVTNKSYWIEEPFLTNNFGEVNKVVSNQDYSIRNYKNVQLIIDTHDGHREEWDWVVPFVGNETSFVFKKYESPFRVTEDDLKYNKKVKYEYGNPECGYQSHRILY